MERRTAAEAFKSIAGKGSRASRPRPGKKGMLGAALLAALPPLMSLIFITPAAAKAPGFPAEAAGLATGSPSLKIDTAIYHMDGGTLQYAFTFVNPTDSVVFLDCQVPPFAAVSGNTLVLTFDRTSLTAAVDESSATPSHGVSGGGGGHGVSSAGTGKPKGPERTEGQDRPKGAGVLAGGPLDGGAVNPDDFPPQRVGPHQAFQGQRKLDRVMGDPHARPAFAKVQLRMAWYPERAEGEGAHYLVERKETVAAPARNAVRKGKAPPPPKIRKFRVPKEISE